MEAIKKRAYRGKRRPQLIDFSSLPLYKFDYETKKIYRNGKPINIAQEIYGSDDRLYNLMKSGPQDRVKIKESVLWDMIKKERYNVNS